MSSCCYRIRAGDHPHLDLIRASFISLTMRLPMPLALSFLLVALLALVGSTLWSRGAGPSDSDVASAAANWVGAGMPQAPRRDGDEWEVDVTRPDGSLVEVTVGDSLQLLGLDEERARGGGPGPDELLGPTRTRAVRAALASSGPGPVLGAERERGGGIEVGVRRRDGTQVEVGLDHRLRVLEVEPEDRRDE
jgi:hypothetical protein